MRTFRILFLNELRSLAYASSTYVAGTIFLVLTALFFLYMLHDFSIQSQTVAPMQQFLKVFWLPLWFLVPLITMRSLAEERRSGTLDTLLTTAATPFKLVMAKFCACYALYCLLWALTLLFPILVSRQLGIVQVDEALLRGAPIAGGYGYVALSGLTMIAMGIFTSSLTRSQLVAGTLCFALLFSITVGATLLQNYGGGWLGEFTPLAEHLRLFKHLEDFSAGVVDSRPLFLHGSLCALFLGLATLVVEGRS